MSLFINQGKQDASNDNQFEPFEEKDIVSVVEKIELNKFLPGNIDVTFRLMNGKHKNWTRKDTVPYEATSPLSWKYRSLRACCGVPYNEKEPIQVDIEALLKDKLLIVDYSITEKDGKKYQKCSYKKIDQQHIDMVFPKVEDDDSETLPFNQAPQPQPQAQPQPAYNAPSIPPVQPQAVTTSNDDDEWE